MAAGRIMVAELASYLPERPDYPMPGAPLVGRREVG